MTLEALLKTLGEQYHSERRDQKKTISKVAEDADVSSLTLSRLEKGDLENVALGTLNKIAGALGKKISITLTD